MPGSAEFRAGRGSHTSLRFAGRLAWTGKIDSAKYDRRRFRAARAQYRASANSILTTSTTDDSATSDFHPRRTVGSVGSRRLGFGWLLAVPTIRQDARRWLSGPRCRLGFNVSVRGRAGGIVGIQRTIARHRTQLGRPIAGQRLLTKLSRRLGNRRTHRSHRRPGSAAPRCPPAFLETAPARGPRFGTRSIESRRAGPASETHAT